MSNLDPGTITLHHCHNGNIVLQFGVTMIHLQPELFDQFAAMIEKTSRHLQELGAVDDVIEEPLGGAHRDHHQMAARLKLYLIKVLEQLSEQPLDGLVAARYEKFRHLGVYLEGME